MNSRRYYQELYSVLYQEITTLTPSCMGLSMEQVVNQFIIEENAHQGTPFIEGLKKIPSGQLKKGVLLHDLSGIGLYMLAYVAANAWAQAKIFQEYEAVVVIPIEWMHLNNELDPNNIRDVLKLWCAPDVDIQEVNLDKVLIIVSGATAPELRVNEKQLGNKHSVSWLATIRKLGVDYIVVSNAINMNGVEKIPYVRSVSLQPLNLTVRYQCVDICTEVTIPGKIVLDCAAMVVERNYLHRDNQDPHLNYTPNWHHQTSHVLTIQDKAYERVTIKPEHMYPPLKAQELIKMILAHITNQPAAENAAANIGNFTTPAAWFAAAVTATAEAEGKNTACYRIGNYLIVRKLANNYLASIDLAKGLELTLPGELKPQENKNELAELAQALHQLINEPDFDNLDTDKLIYRLDQIASMLRKEVKRKLHVSSEKALISMKDKMRLENPAKSRFTRLFSRAETDLTYHTIQKNVNEELRGVVKQTQFVRRLLNGDAHQAPKTLTHGLAATLLSETCRYRINFIATLCLIDLIELSEQEETMWQMFFAHPKHVYDGHQPSLKSAVIDDIVHTLGGLQVMSHGNSFNQVKAKAAQPALGMHWVDFKSHCIIGHWLSTIIASEKNVNPHLTASMTNATRGKVIHDLLFDFSNLRRINPHIYDRLSRRLDTFDFMLSHQKPLREILSGSIEQALNFVKSNQFPVAIRPMLPKELNTRTASLDYNLFLTMAARFQLGVALSENESGNGDIHELSMAQGEYVHKKQSVTDYRISHLNSILSIDPLFYAIHYYLAYLYLIDLQQPKIALIHLGQYFALAKPSDGDLYFGAFYIKLRCLIHLNEWASFDKNINYYLEKYLDKNDHDYWRAFLLRAIANHDRNILSEKALRKDVQLFLSNVPYEPTNDHHAALILYLSFTAILNNGDKVSIAELKDALQKMCGKLKEMNANLYIHKNGFFSPSKYARLKQAYGPYSDHFCYPNSQAVRSIRMMR